MAEEDKLTTTGDSSKSAPLIGPDAERRRRLVELLHAFLEDKVSLAELQGVSKEKLFLLAEAGYVKFKHGRLDESEKIYQALIVLDHLNPYYHAVMGAIHQKRKRPVQAILEYTRAVQMDNKDIASYVNRGEIYLRHRNFRKAAEDFKKAILLDATGRNMWANRSRSLVIALKRSIEAEKKGGKRPKRPKPSEPHDAAAKDSGRVPKEGTPTPPTPSKAVPRKRKRKVSGTKKAKKKK